MAKTANELPILWSDQEPIARSRPTRRDLICGEKVRGVGVSLARSAACLPSLLAALAKPLTRIAALNDASAKLLFELKLLLLHYLFHITYWRLGSLGLLLNGGLPTAVSCIRR